MHGVSFDVLCFARRGGRGMTLKRVPKSPITHKIAEAGLPPACLSANGRHKAQQEQQESYSQIKIVSRLISRPPVTDEVAEVGGKLRKPPRCRATPRRGTRDLCNSGLSKYFTPPGLSSLFKREH